MSNAGGQKEGANREEEEKKNGRPGAVAALGRDRRHSLESTATVLDLWKRKRAEEGEKGEEDVDEMQERERVFRKSRKVHRSPEGKTGEEGKAEGGGIQDMLRLIREELKLGLEEVKGQGRGIREEMEKIEGKMTRREEQWEVERGETKEMIRDLGKRLEEIDLLKIMSQQQGAAERHQQQLLQLLFDQQEQQKQELAIQREQRERELASQLEQRRLDGEAQEQSETSRHELFGTTVAALQAVHQVNSSGEPAVTPRGSRVATPLPSPVPAPVPVPAAQEVQHPRRSQDVRDSRFVLDILIEVN
ncbi:vicilin-like seed storage protein At2g18540 [Neodiprion fabricii]|uniref:vicilin-like seed storage protein At2g18540 n=1 Tax=Neodiprion fabricii TaxID=2872261 RepID=UPI001ED91C22|nr:vicilin-like seed storage protein At2g18540 [Neodiprion fabricii]